MSKGLDRVESSMWTDEKYMVPSVSDVLRLHEDETRDDVLGKVENSCC